MIAVDHLNKIYPGNVLALRDVNLQIGAGMFGLLGPNGAGKTTLMRIVAGLLRSSSGKVTVQGHDLNTRHGRQQIKAFLGYLPQELGLYPHLTAREFLDYVGILKGIKDADARRKQVDSLIDTVRLGDAADRQLKTYSGGMKRRVGIAQAMLGDPQLLIVDEPTVGLDPEERVRIRNLLGELARRCTVILSTHIIEDIGLSCNALAVINNGSVLFQGAPADLIRQARGKVWSIRAADLPTGDFTLVATLQLADSVQYRVVGERVVDLFSNVEQVEPSLEDSYINLMRRH
ncbi:MAG: ABC transporter ATP-binding protein [Anaerolineae bacterium]|nr:ABC transporter ATP-binding protein [Anaerolineae bacterium]